MNWIIISAVFLLSAGAVYLVSNRILLLIPALLLGIGSVIIYLRYPLLGLLALIISTQVDFGFGRGTASEIHLTLLLLVFLIGFGLFEIIVRKKQLLQVSSRTIPPLLTLCLVAVLSFAVGQLPWFITVQAAPILSQAAGLAIFILSAGAFLWIAYQVRELRWLQWMTWLFIALCGIILIFRLMGPSGRLVLDRLPNGSTGSLFWTWLAAVAFSQAIFNRKLDLRWRVIIVAILVGHLYINLTRLYDWKSGWLPPLVVIGTILLLRYPKYAPFLILAGLLLFWSFPGQIISSDRYSVDTRLVAWQIILGDIASVNPLLGVGPANYRFYTPLFPILGWEVEFNSHNNYVDIIAQIGLLGFCCFLWFAWETGRLGWKLKDRVPEGFTQAYVYGALAGLVGTLFAGMLGDWVIPFVYNIGLVGFRSSILAWLFLGGVVVLEQIYIKPTNIKSRESKS